MDGWGPHTHSHSESQWRSLGSIPARLPSRGSENNHQWKRCSRLGSMLQGRVCCNKGRMLVSKAGCCSVLKPANVTSVFTEDIRQSSFSHLPAGSGEWEEEGQSGLILTLLSTLHSWARPEHPWCSGVGVGRRGGCPDWPGTASQ